MKEDNISLDPITIIFINKALQPQSQHWLFMAIIWLLIAYLVALPEASIKACSHTTRITRF